MAFADQLTAAVQRSGLTQPAAADLLAALKNCESMMRQANAIVLERMRGRGDVFWERALDDARAAIAKATASK